jgi:hypothetical protein
VTPAAVAGIVMAVARHPSLWAVAVRPWWRTTPHGWWRHAPFLPLPSGDYLRFRLVTQYGTQTHRIDPSDVLNYLAWCKRQEHIG